MSRLEKLLEQRNKLNKELHDLVASEPGDYTESVDRSGLEERMFKYQRDKDKAAVSAQRDARKARGKGQIAEGILGMADALSRVASSRAGGIRSDKPIDLDMESYFKGQQERKYEDVQEALSEEDVQLRKASSALRKKEEDARQKGTTTRRQLLAEKRKEREDLNEQIRIAREQESEAPKAKKAATKTDRLNKQLEKDREGSLKDAEKLAKAYASQIELEKDDEGNDFDGTELLEALEARGIDKESEAYKLIAKTVKPGLFSNEDEEEQAKIMNSETMKKALQKALLRDMLIDRVRAGNPINPERVSGLGLSLEDIKSEAEALGYEVTLKGGGGSPTTELTPTGDRVRVKIKNPKTGKVTRMFKTRAEAEAMKARDPSVEIEN